MKPIFHCELEYAHSPHLAQVYDGFYKLQQRKIITVSVKRGPGNPVTALLKVRLWAADSDRMYTVYYDALDGLNWISAESTEENLIYFRDNFKADYYFKRSFNPDVLKYSPENCKVYPLGLNYYVDSKHDFNPYRTDRLKKYIKCIIPRRYHSGTLYSNDYEFPPISNKDTKILFLTRLWDIGEVTGHSKRREREDINDCRIECIEACRREFGNAFTGGLQKNRFAMHHAKDLIAPSGLTNKTAFIRNIRLHNICIATTGLHNSISWKFAEYISNSRAIISEPLQYKVPGEFGSGKNYYEFSGKNELIRQIYYLLNNKEKLQEMMYENFLYYNNFVRSDRLVLNTLLTVHFDECKSRQEVVTAA